MSQNTIWPLGPMAIARVHIGAGRMLYAPSPDDDPPPNSMSAIGVKHCTQTDLGHSDEALNNDTWYGDASGARATSGLEKHWAGSYSYHRQGTTVRHRWRPSHPTAEDNATG